MARALVFAAVLMAWPVGTGCGATTTPDAADGASPAPDTPGAVADAAGTCIDRDIEESNYDASCTVDTDCRVIATGNTCSPCAFSCGVGGGAIGVGALARYLSDIANTPALVGVGDAGCPPCEAITGSGNANLGPFCCAGQCHIGSECPDNGVACQAAGGQCVAGECPSSEYAEAQGCGVGDNCCLRHSDAGPDANALCAASGCIATCVSGAHNVMTMVDGCYVWQCCVPA